MKLGHYVKRFIYIYRTDGLKTLAIRVLIKLQNNLIPRWIQRLSGVGHAGGGKIRITSNTYSLEGILSYRPRISILMPAYNTDPVFLKEAIESVTGQSYDNWELVISDDGSTDPRTLEILKEADRNEKIHVIFNRENRGISAASNKGLEKVEGEFCALLDHDDILHRDALIQFVRAIQNEDLRDTDICYTNENKIHENGSIAEPTFHKPDYNKLLLLSVNYFCHFLIVRTRLLREIKGFRSEYDGAQDYDLILRLIEKTDRILHIPVMLYSWRINRDSTAGFVEAKPYARDAGKKAIEDYCRRNSIDAEVEFARSSWYRLKYQLKSRPRVAIIIPFKDKVDILKALLVSIEENTRYENYKVYLVNNASVEPETNEFLNQTDYDVIHYNRPFNFSRIYNEVINSVEEECCLLLNNDMEVLNEDWLENMVEHVQLEGVAAVGALLLYPNNSVQHAGVVTTPYHKMFALNLNNNFGGSVMEMYLQQYVNGVSGACMLVNKKIYQDVGGFDEVNFPIGFSDVDLCLRFIRAGYKIVYTPYAQLYHKESESRKLNNESYEAFMLANKYLIGKTDFYDPFRSRFSLSD